MTLPGTTLESRSRRSVPDAGTAPGRGPATHFRPLFFGDWTRALFIHYEVNAAELQQEVPFELDLWNGRAFVSLVAFTMERLRPRFWGKFGAWLFHPIATTRYLNVRTYVRRGNEIG